MMNNWRFCIDSPQKRALNFCSGSMNTGDGYGVGDTYGHSDGDDSRYAGGPRRGLGCGPYNYRDGYGYGNKNGDRQGDSDGDGKSKTSWY